MLIYRFQSPQKWTPVIEKRACKSHQNKTSCQPHPVSCDGNKQPINPLEIPIQFNQSGFFSMNIELIMKFWMVGWWETVCPRVQALSRNCVSFLDTGGAPIWNLPDRKLPPSWVAYFCRKNMEKLRPVRGWKHIKNHILNQISRANIASLVFFVPEPMVSPETVQPVVSQWFLSSQPLIDGFVGKVSSGNHRFEVQILGAVQRFPRKYPGWWFEPLWKILVNWDDYSQYMGK